MKYDDQNIFARVLRGEIPADVVYEDEQCLAFRDINPQAPTHVLVVPRKALAMVAHTAEEDEPLLGHLLRVASGIADSEGLAEGGYRLVINNGVAAGQTVFHLHVHLLGGRPMSWPPG